MSRDGDGAEDDSLLVAVAQRLLPEEDLPPGSSLGRYEVLERLGAGGMGVVYAARDPELNRRVAVKVLRPGAALQPEARTRLVREAQAMAALSHPNVIAVHDVGSVGEQVFLDDLVYGVPVARPR